MGLPQWIYLVLMLLSMLVSICRLGEPKAGRYQLTDVFLGPLVALSLLYWGGFFGGVQ